MATSDGITDPQQDRSAHGRLVELLTCAQRNWLLAMEGGQETRTEAILHVLNYFSTAWYLRALMQAAPDLAEEKTDHLIGILEDGGDVGEWIWDLLLELGVDPKTIEVVKR